MASLQAAFTFAQMDDVAVPVGEHLYLDVPGIQYESLEEQCVVPERRGRLAPCTDERRLQFGRLVHDPHAAPTTGRTSTG